MSSDVYRRLAQTLDAMPNGYPATESGVELKLLAKMFTPEEAALASVMRVDGETADVIAARAGVDAKVAGRTLRAMARKGLIFANRHERKLVFWLMPFVVGFYEEQLPRLDREMAELFEAYFQEMQGALTQQNPAVHRVLPVEETIAADVKVYSYERASDLLDGAKAWGVRDCICRVQQKLIGKGCDSPVENCLVFAPVENVFDYSETTRAISKEEAKRLLHEAEEAGLVHSPGNYQDGNNYICNCCTCCCGVIRSVAEFSVPSVIAKSDFFLVVDDDACAGCGDCLERCQFGALVILDDICVVDIGRCVGCGLCATVCPSGALSLVRRPEGEIPPPPANHEAWEVQRIKARGMG